MINETKVVDAQELDTQLLARWNTVKQQIQQSAVSVDKRDDSLKHPHKNNHIDNTIDNPIDSHADKQPDADSNTVNLIAVSKTKPAHMIEVLAKAGQVDFGENYLQEAIEKIESLKQTKGCDNIVWHYIGHIQRNKTRDIAEHFDWVHTVEREIIAKRLNNQRPDNLPNLNVLIQVNIDNEENKSGCLPDEVDSLVSKIKEYERLNLRGLMIIPAVIESHGDDEKTNVTSNITSKITSNVTTNAKTNTNTNIETTDENQIANTAVNAQAFECTRALFDTIKNNHPELTQWDTLSMGMSADMEAAIKYGSTMVRVGTAIFGER